MSATQGFLAPPASKRSVRNLLRRAIPACLSLLLGCGTGGHDRGRVPILMPSVRHLVARPLSGAEVSVLDREGLVIAGGVDVPSFDLGYSALFKAHEPVYITADAILHALHRSYDHILADVEKGALIPELSALLAELRDGVARATGASAEARADLDLYLAVARGLLDGSPASPVAGARPEEIRAPRGRGGGGGRPRGRGALRRPRPRRLLDDEAARALHPRAGAGALLPGHDVARPHRDGARAPRRRGVARQPPRPRRGPAAPRRALGFGRRPRTAASTRPPPSSSGPPTPSRSGAWRGRRGPAGSPASRTSPGSTTRASRRRSRARLPSASAAGWPRAARSRLSCSSSASATSSTPRSSPRSPTASSPRRG